MKFRITRRITHARSDPEFSRAVQMLCARMARVRSHWSAGGNWVSEAAPIDPQAWARIESGRSMLRQGQQRPASATKRGPTLRD